MLHSSLVIWFYSNLIDKKKIKNKKNVSQTQDNSRFIVTVFGNSKRIYDVKWL